MIFNLLLFGILLEAAKGQLGPWGGPGSIGYKAPIHQSSNNQVSGWGAIHPKPLTLSGGADWANSRGNGASVNVMHQPKGLTQGTVGGTVGLIHTPQQQLSGSFSHTKTFDSNFKEIGHGVNTAGLGYKITSNDGKTSVGANAQTTFGQGMKPIHQVGIGVQHNFR